VAIFSMPTLVIQLGRLGDVIQTTPLLQELSRQSRMKCSHSETAERIELLVVQANQEGVHAFEVLSSIRTVGEDLKSLDDQIARGFRHGAIPDEAQRLLARLNLPCYDRAINASHAARGCWLAGEIPCDSREGGIINREGECLYRGEAHTYRVALLEFREQKLVQPGRFAVMCGSASPEIFDSFGLESFAPYVEVSEGLPFALPPGRRVALNVGANEKHRRWPASHR
jgi:hypothetical protein